MFLSETYIELLKDPAHWAFEITLIVIFDVLLGMVLWPFAKKWLKNHDARKHAHQHCEDVHQEKLFD